MNNAKRIYEAHIHTVHLSNDPLIVEFQNEILPLVQEMVELSEMQEHKAALLEADGLLQWDDINVIFKAAQKASKGGVLDKAVGAGKEKLSSASSAVTNKINDKLLSMVSKYQAAAPVSNAAGKVDKLAQKALASVKDQKDKTLNASINKIANYAKNNPRVANVAIAILTTAISYSGTGVAGVAVSKVVELGMKLMQKQMGDSTPETKEVDPVQQEFEQAYEKALKNIMQTVSSKNQSKAKNAVDKLYNNGASEQSLKHMTAIAQAQDPRDLGAAIKKSRGFRAGTNESLERILGWRV